MLPLESLETKERKIIGKHSNTHEGDVKSRRTNASHSCMLRNLKISIATFLKYMHFNLK
jgi:hypothetical protein